ncbi:MAG TPA: succinate dehydrogenase cytochrome b subunit [Opitutales bacterium]|nr:succinate dehydrogenase cytochrome b subunit [Opitutales bacterium]
MNGIIRLLTSSVGKKYLMAITGAILALFVLGHMVGNLQYFLPEHWINAYAHHLQHLPYGLLWVIRAVLFATIVIHIVVGVMLTLHNVQARPGYEVDGTIQASIGSRTMIWTGLVLLAFATFHIFHYTVKNVQDFSAIPDVNYVSSVSCDGTAVVETETVMTPDGTMTTEPVKTPNVQAIMKTGFSVTGYAFFYIFAVGMLMLHLSHGVSSVFQTLGLRNEVWRYKLNCLAWLYAAAVFIGFASTPISVLIGKL